MNFNVFCVEKIGLESVVVNFYLFRLEMRSFSILGFVCMVERIERKEFIV